MSYTRIVGVNAGIEAVRKVRPGGIVHFNHEKIQSERLILFVGQDVFICDMDGDLWVYTVRYDLYSTIRKKKPIPKKGNFIVTLKY